MVARSIAQLLGASVLLSGCLQFADDFPISAAPDAAVTPDAATDAGAEGPRFNAVEVAGNCATGDTLEIWTIPLAGEVMLRPTDTLDGATLTQAYTQDAVFFAPPPVSFAGSDNTDAVRQEAGVPEAGWDREARSLRPRDVDYLPNGGRMGEPRLTVIVLDNSAAMQAADSAAARLSFTKKLLRLLGANDPSMRVGLVVCGADQADIGAEPGPGDVDAVDNALFGLELDAAGTSPTGDCLDAALTVADGNANLVTSVFLLTQDFAGGQQAKVDEVVDTFANRARQIPLVVALLRGDAPTDFDVQAAACRTGGSAVHITGANEMDAVLRPGNRDHLTPALAGRLIGGWRLEASLSALPAGDWLLSTELRVNLGGVNGKRRLDAAEGRDSRLLLRAE